MAEVYTYPGIRIADTLTVWGCSDVSYDSLPQMHDFQTKETSYEVSVTFLDSLLVDDENCMSDPTCAVQLCFFGGPKEVGIPIAETLPIFTAPRLVDPIVVRGAKNILRVERDTVSPGYLAWVSHADLEATGKTDVANPCPTVGEAKSAGSLQDLSGDGESEEFIFIGTVGKYVACLVDNKAASDQSTLMNVLGDFNVFNAIHKLRPSAARSTRTTIRMDVEPKLGGSATCVVKTVEALSANLPNLEVSGIIAGMSENAIAKLQKKSRRALLEFLLDEEGEMARVQFTIPTPLPPNVTVSVVLNNFPTTPAVPVWCFHDDKDVRDNAITEPESPYGLLFTMPGENPEGHFLPSFLWPGAHTVPWIQHIPSAEAARVTLVSSDDECGIQEYGDAVPVIQNDRSMPLSGYLTATLDTPMLCFFELSTSSPLLLDNVYFQQTAIPKWQLGIEGVQNLHIHRGLPVTVSLSDVHPDDLGELFLLPVTTYEANGGYCVEPFDVLGNLAPDNWPDGDIEKKAAVPRRPVGRLPVDSGGYSHYSFIDELETPLLRLGEPYYLCYVGNATDAPRIYNVIPPAIYVKDVITAIDRDRAVAEANSLVISILVENTLTGTIMCLCATDALPNIPNSNEIAGTYYDGPSIVNEANVLARSGVVEAVTPNSNVSVLMDVNQENVPQIGKTPIGVRPEVHVWCMHSRSIGVVFPNTPSGYTLELGVTPPPPFIFRRAGSTLPVLNLTLAQLVPFAPLELAFEVEGFPRYDYDDVDITVSPPLPQGVALITDRSTKTTQIIGDPAPALLFRNPMPNGYTITAASTRELVNPTVGNINLEIVEAVVCEAQIVKSVDMVLACRMHDTHNFHSTGIYMVHEVYTPQFSRDLELFDDCRGLFMEDRVGTNLFECQGLGDKCCCFVRTSWSEAAEDPKASYNYAVSVVKQTHGACSIAGEAFQEYGKYSVTTMAVGVDIYSGNARREVVSSAALEYQIPKQPEDPEPVKFEISLEDFDFAACDPATQSEDVVKACRDELVAELEKLLGLENVDCGTDANGERLPCIDVGDFFEEA
jgi:hypothetical protein